MYLLELLLNFLLALCFHNHSNKLVVIVRRAFVKGIFVFFFLRKIKDWINTNEFIFDNVLLFAFPKAHRR
jgi:hypothetical protein